MLVLVVALVRPDMIGRYCLSSLNLSRLLQESSNLGYLSMNGFSRKGQQESELCRGTVQVLRNGSRALDFTSESNILRIQYGVGKNSVS